MAITSAIFRKQTSERQGTKEYDLSGNRLSAQYMGDGAPINYTYDALNCLSTISENGRLTNYGYAISGNLTNKNLPQ